MRSRVSEKGRERSTASCARRTFAAATSFIAEVIFLVFLTEATRSRSSRMVAPIWGSTTRAGACGVTADAGRAASGAWKAAAHATHDTKTEKTCMVAA